MKRSDMATVAPFKTQNIPTGAILSTQNIGAFNIWLGRLAGCDQLEPSKTRNKYEDRT